jgi:hypothetical protein
VWCNRCNRLLLHLPRDKNNGPESPIDDIETANVGLSLVQSCDNMCLGRADSWTPDTKRRWEMFTVLQLGREA